MTAGTVFGAVPSDDARIVDVLHVGGHSVITYRWRGGIVRSTGPAGRTEERIAEIIERGDQ